MLTALLIVLAALAVFATLYRILYARRYRQILRRNLPLDRRVLSEAVNLFHQLKSRDPAAATAFMDSFDGGLAGFVPGQVQANAKAEMISLESAIHNLRRERAADPDILSTLARGEEQLQRLRAELE